MKSKMRGLKFVGILILSSCATTPYPYFDSAFNDKNRAPSSITSEVQDKSSDKDDSELNQKSKAEFFFLKGDLLSQEGKSEQALEAFKEAHYYDPTSGMVAYRIAIEYFRKSLLTDAVYWGSKAIDRDPKNKDYKLFIAGLFTSQRDYAKAEDVYLELIKENPKYAEPVLYLAALYSEQKKFKQAQEYFSKLVLFKDYEQRHLGYYYRGRIEFESAMTASKGKSAAEFAAAKKDLENALELKPDLMEALQILGRMLEKNSGREAAFKFYVKYQKSKGPFPKLAETLSQYFIEKGDFDGAYEQLEIVEKSSDDDIGVKLKLALILIDRKNFPMALEKLEKLNQLVPDSDKVKFYTAAVLEELHKDTQAIEMYMAIPLNSSHFEDSRINTAQIYKKAKNYGAAIHALEEVISKKQGKFQVYLSLAQVYEEQTNWSSAITTLKDAEKKFTDNNQINYFLGILYDRSGDFKNMKSYMLKAMTNDKNHFQAMNYLAYTMAEKNENLTEARDLAAQAYKLASDDGYIIDTLGWIYYKLTNYDKAEELLEKAHEFLPDVAVIAEHLGDVYLKQNKHDKATRTFRKALKVETDEARKKLIMDKITMVETANPESRRPASSLSNEVNKDE